MVVAFTGTRSGMTDEQVSAVCAVLTMVHPTLVFHGACEGADRQFHELCKNVRREMYPARPDQLEWAEQHRTETDGINRLVVKKNPEIHRNRLMVDFAEMVIAAPSSMTEQMRGSGTWATIRYARKTGKNLVIVQPNGDFDIQGEWK